MFLTLFVLRADGGLEGECRLPLLADRSGKICKKYGVFDADEGVARKALVVIDTTGQLTKHRQL
jgi:alkyl hydroperoxide reductase subunit AhpC